MNLLLLGESSYLSISKSFSSAGKWNHLSSRLNAWRGSLSLKVNFFEITVLFQKLGPQYEMQYWLKFFRHRVSWIEISFRSTYLVFVLWVKIFWNTGGFQFYLHLYIKHRILKKLTWKHLRLSYHLIEDLRVHNWPLPRQYLQSLHNYE